MPLPNGGRIQGHNMDLNIQYKTWQAMRIPAPDGLAGKTVLDVGANDGYFTLAALMSGAAEVTALDSRQWYTFPANLLYAAQQWGLTDRIRTVVADFRTHPFDRTYDVILFLGVLYHLEDVFGALKLLRGLLADGGALILETQMTLTASDLPLFECASDIYPTVAEQNKRGLDLVGISNYLFPNHAAMMNLAYSYDFDGELLNTPDTEFKRSMPSRGLYKFIKRPEGLSADEARRRLAAAA
jgi:SAM-dependent methyltransferase